MNTAVTALHDATRAKSSFTTTTIFDSGEALSLRCYNSKEITLFTFHLLPLLTDDLSMFESSPPMRGTEHSQEWRPSV